MKQDTVCAYTRPCYLWTNILDGPLMAMHNTFLMLILCKSLGASPLMIVLGFVAKHAVAIFSFYWSSRAQGRPDLLKSNIIWAGILGKVPSLFFPFFNAPWFFLLAFSLYMMSTRAVIPAWTEILKLKYPSKYRGKVCSDGVLANSLIEIFLPLLLGSLLDTGAEVAKWLFAGSAALSLISLFLQGRISVPSQKLAYEKANFHTLFIAPWKTAYKLLKKRSDFARFQGIYMLGGLGIMLMQPALPIFTTTVLGLSYTAIALALAFCKGIGFAMTTRFWALAMERIPFHALCGFVALLAALFPLLVMGGYWALPLFFIGYLFYGVMRAGSDITWRLSGPLFSKDEDSAPYSTTTTVLIGVRGSVGPLLGGTLMGIFGLFAPLIGGSLLCLGGAFYGIFMTTQRSRLQKKSIPG